MSQQFVTIAPEDAARAIAHECGQEMAAFLTRGREEELIAAIVKVLEATSAGTPLTVPDIGTHEGRLAVLRMPFSERDRVLSLINGPEKQNPSEWFVEAHAKAVAKDIKLPDTPLTRLICHKGDQNR